MTETLNERLLKVESGGSDYTGITTNWYRNPDGPEAATTIAQLSADLEKARKRAQALEVAISWIEPPFVDENTTADELRSRVQCCVADSKRAKELSQ